MPESILRRARPLMLARIGGAALTFAVPMVIARVIPPSGFGTYKQAWLIASTLYLVLPMGVTLSLYYFVPREPHRRDLFVGQALLGTTAVGAVAAALIVAGRPLIAAHFHNPELDRCLPWVAALAFAMLAGTALDVALNAVGRIGAAAAVRVGTEVVRGACMVAGALATRSAAGLLAGMTAGAAIRAVACWAWLVRSHGLRISPRALRTQLAYALPFGLAFLAIVPQQQFHLYAVGAAVSAAAFAVYSVGCFQLPIVDFLYTPVSEILQIGLAEQDACGDDAAGLRLFHEAVSRLAFAFLPLMGLFFVAAPAFLGFVFTDRYLGAVPIFRIGLSSVPLAALPLDGVMRARAQNRFMLALSIAKLAATVPLVLGGLALLGPAGAIAGWIAAEAASRAAQLARTATLFRTRIARVLPTRDLVRQALAALSAMPAAWAALELVPAPRLASLVVSALAYALVYLGASWALGSLPPEWIPRPRRAERPRAVPAPAPAPPGE